MTKKAKHHLATRAIHAGQKPDPATGAIMTPIYASSTYVQRSPGDHQGWEYSRSHNPTRDAYEQCIADLEGGSRGFAFASGMAATATVLELLDSGSPVAASLLTFDAVSFQAKGRWLESRKLLGAPVGFMSVTSVYAGGPPIPGRQVA